MELAVVDLKAVHGQEIFIRIVDDASGGWGHINFDNFRFHDNKPAVRRKSTPACPTSTPTPASVPKTRRRR